MPIFNRPRFLEVALRPGVSPFLPNGTWEFALDNDSEVAATIILNTKIKITSLRTPSQSYLPYLLEKVLVSKNTDEQKLILINIILDRAYAEWIDKGLGAYTASVWKNGLRTQALQIAARTNNAEMVRPLIQAGANANEFHDTPNQLHVLPLEVAVQQKNNLMINALLVNGANANLINPNPNLTNTGQTRTAFTLACSNPATELQAIYMLNHPNFTLPQNFRDMIVLACQGGQFNLLKALWQRAQVDGKTAELQKVGTYALFYAIEKGDRNSVEFLLKSGADYTRLEKAEKAKMDRMMGVQPQKKSMFSMNTLFVRLELQPDQRQVSAYFIPTPR